MSQDHLYQHCKHCCWGNKHHPDDTPGHTTPCTSGCTNGNQLLEHDLLDLVVP